MAVEEKIRTLKQSLAGIAESGRLRIHRQVYSLLIDRLEDIYNAKLEAGIKTSMNTVLEMAEKWMKVLQKPQVPVELVKTVFRGFSDGSCAGRILYQTIR
ncbi:hypothetical protein V7S43_014497 [Phytophthora oleae]|uniref:Uncharacterized protein n=1 Tax=Phytophthora oleae TaxID=2107226 RepID=A0ABD3F0N1_9STRA